ncbi:hypothetical protein N0V82_004434 [Gnomoniopsis sp. IMI 355080]|nr:hypothetical protein N0V82_004434 [Gnomoniopsis sp. IMI 355080]
MSCFRVPRARCGLHYGFIYDCYDEDDKDKMDGASADGPELPSESANNSSTTEENRSQVKHE